jgi:membrane protein required for beta-lactamase induction
VNLLAILIALAGERLVGPRPELRESRALVGYVRGALRIVARRDPPSRLAAFLAALLPGVVAGLAGLALGAVAHRIGYVLFAALVLYVTLGPRDLRREVAAYRAAAARGDSAAAAQAAGAVLGANAFARRRSGLGSVGEAVFVQANDRLFGALFWFAILGPCGALAFRVAALMRREAMQRVDRADAPDPTRAVGDLCGRLYGAIAYLPACMLALTYGLAGNFGESVKGWRSSVAAESEHFFESGDHLLVHAGRGALEAAWDEAPDEPDRARQALALADSALYIWLAVIALSTLLEWLV